MAGLGATELVIMAFVVVFFFGARKLPELARGSGQALRIFRSEVRTPEGNDVTAVLD
jgi:sec-independent protein translocase protein TatA